MLSLSISYPYLIKFHDFASGGDEASNGGCNSGPIGHDFPHNSTIYFLFFTMRTGPFPKCEDRSSSQIECQGENPHSGSHGGSHPRFSVRTGLKTGTGYHQMGENRPTLDCKLYNRWVMSYWEYHWGTSLGTDGEHDGNTRKKIPSSPRPPQKEKWTCSCVYV
jgi:hypothetical protein